VNGDAATLKELLHHHPALITARSDRDHHAMLLHYTAANGVEDYRQRTPPNIVEITRMLLDAGAEVDAVGAMYGGSTTLGLAATSCHPANAGVQEALVDLLMDYGADPAIAVSPGYDGDLITACLANGRGKAAIWLAKKGVPTNLEGAAGIGDLDALKSWLHEDGSLKDETLREKLNAGFNWACEFGHLDVVRFLVENGFDLSTLTNGMTGLHWAAIGGQAEMVRFLLEKGAPLEIENCYGGTVLGQALWSAKNEPLQQHDEIIRILRAAGAKETGI
jgi:ankyrin repeat protein